MHLLITRPEPDAHSFAERLANHGHQCTISPLLKLDFRKPPELNAVRAQALIITSRNALRAVERHPQKDELYKTPLFVVGSNSAEIAENAGFTKIAGTAKNARSLAQAIAGQCSPDNGPLIYLTGMHLAFDMAAELGKLNFELERSILYDTKPADGFSEEAKKALISGEIDGVILLSPRTATIFSDLINRDDFTGVTERLIHYCLSENIAKILENSPNHNIRIAAKPDMSSMIKLINEYNS